MKKILLLTGFALLTLISVSGKADHNSSSGSVARLVWETRELVREVQFAPLNYQVKNTVFRFNQDTAVLERCVRYFGDSPVDDHTENVGVPYRCQQELRNVQFGFQSVERFLRDTYYEFPRVYRAFVEVAQALRAISVVNHPHPGPGPGPGPHPGPGPIFTQFRCQAADAGWEEHGGGHIAFSRRIEQAQRQALYECQRFHGRCRIIRCDQVQ